jgi:hypothetical protein
MGHMAGRKITIAQWAEVCLALIPASLLALVLLPFAAAAAMGVGIALMEHLRVGNPFWRIDLLQIGDFVGSAMGGVCGVSGLWMAVFQDPDKLRNEPVRWWLTVVGLAVGAATAWCWLASGYWP